MHKSNWLPFAAALLLLSPAVHASLEVYGTAHVSLDHIDNDDPDPANVANTWSLTSGQSHIGFRGREALPDRLAVLWQAEHGIDLDSGGWGTGRDTFVGLETRFGQVLLGKHATPYRMSTEALDVFADTRADYNAVIGSIAGASLFNNRADNALLYLTPAENRLRLALAYSTRLAGEDDLPRSKDESRQDALSASLVFADGPLYLGYAYESLGERLGPGLDDAVAKKFGVGWDFGQGTRLGFIRESAGTGEKISGTEAARTAYYLSLAHIHGNLTYKFAYGRLDALDGVPDSGADYVALGAGYALSARTGLYLLYAAVLNDAAGSYGLQPDHDGTAAIAAAGGDVGALSAGLVHRFEFGL